LTSHAQRLFAALQHRFIKEHFDMAESEANLPEDMAEKAYAEATEASLVTPKVEELPIEPAPVAAAAPEPVAIKPKRAAPKAKVAKPAKPAAPKEVMAPAAKPAKVAKPKVAAKAKVSPKPAAPKRKAATKPITTKSSKEPVMATKKTAAKPAGIKQIVAEAQIKAKAAYLKGGAVLNEAGEFTKGNVEALVHSGKILSTGVQALGKTYVAEAKTAIETTKADVKALAAVKTPTAFFKLQGDILRRNFDDALALSSKNTKAVFKLANDSFAPIQGRVGLAVSKVKKAA
jgi:hypothetical protein